MSAPLFINGSGIGYLDVTGILSWKRDTPGLCVLLLAGQFANGMPAWPRIHGVMDDFGNFVATRLEP